MVPSDGALNVILFGEVGVGKSSVVNLLAGARVAKISSDAKGCTLQSTKHTVNLDATELRIWDTVGLDDPEMDYNKYLAAIEKAHGLIRDLGHAGGVDLLLFCIRAGRITMTTQSNFRLFYEVLCNKEVPIALVVTNLERETRMEDWWSRNEPHIKAYGINSIGHACVTAIEEDEKYAESKEVLRNLLMSQVHNQRRFSMKPESWLAVLLQGLKSFLGGHRQKGKILTVHTLIKRCNLDGDTARGVANILNSPVSDRGYADSMHRYSR